jgi:hypothetical protein
MTDARMNLPLAEKTPDADILREMIAFAAGRLMDLKGGALTGAAPWRKGAGRFTGGKCVQAG